MTRTVLAAAALLLAAGCSALANPDSSDLDPIAGGMDAAAGADAGGGQRDSAGPPGREGGTEEIDAGGPPPERDAEMPPEGDAGVPPPPDAGPIATGPTVPCGEATCEAGTSRGCCFTERAGPYCFGDGAGAACECEGTLCWTTEATCNGASDCPGTERCCAYWGVTDAHPNRFVCATMCRSSFGSAREVCDPTDARPCVGGAACGRADELPPGYGICD